MKFETRFHTWNGSLFVFSFVGAVKQRRSKTSHHAQPAAWNSTRSWKKHSTTQKYTTISWRNNEIIFAKKQKYCKKMIILQKKLQINKNIAKDDYFAKKYSK